MTTRSAESTHEAEPNRSQPNHAVESPSADQMTGANGPSGDQDIDTAGTDADDQSPTKSMGTGVPGDTNSADIVGRTGEEMPVQSHDGLDSESRPRSVAKGCSKEPVRADDDNPRGNVAD